MEDAKKNNNNLTSPPPRQKKQKKQMVNFLRKTTDYFLVLFSGNFALDCGQNKAPIPNS